MGTILERQFETLALDFASGVATLALNRPDQLNAMNRQLRQELGDFFLGCAQEPSIRAVIVTGSGRAFSAGGDINDFSANPEEMHELMGSLTHRWFKALWALPQPVIAAVNGIASGAGCNLALGCDLVVASSEASFVQSFLKIGLAPDAGGMFSLPRLVGLHRAKELALLGDRIGATEAERLGLVNRVVAPEQLLPEAQAIAQRLTDASAKAITLTKRILNRSFESSMEAILDDEWMAQSFLFGTEASQSGVQAFLDKRKKT